MRWLQVGRPCSPRWQHYRYCLEISSRLRNQMCADCLPTPRWRMLDIHSLDWSLAIATGFSAALFYATIYAITLVGAFGVVAMVRRETGGDDFSNFAGLGSRSPLLAGCMSVFMLSLAGIPPLAGFFGKFYLFSVALRAGANHGLLWLVAVALLGSFISLYYYLMVLKAIFVDEPVLASRDHVGVLPSALLTRATVTVLAAAVLLLGITPEILAAPILAAMP